MFPIKDDNPQLGTPYAVYIIIAINIAAWFVLQGMGSDPSLTASVCKFGLIPADLSSSVQMLERQICPPGIGWAGLVSSMFMHGSWMHIIGNMWFLWIFGDNIEDAMGSIRFTIFYTLCGLCAAAAQILADPQSQIPMVGASGAIGGIMGAYIVLYPKVKVHLLLILVVIFTTIRVPAIAMLGYWIALQIFGGLSTIGASGGGVAFWAHVGGFVAGTTLIWVFKDEEMLTNHPYYGWHRRRDPKSVWDQPENRQ